MLYLFIAAAMLPRSAKLVYNDETWIVRYDSIQKGHGAGA